MANAESHVEISLQYCRRIGCLCRAPAPLQSERAGLNYLTPLRVLEDAGPKTNNLCCFIAYIQSCLVRSSPSLIFHSGGADLRSESQMLWKGREALVAALKLISAAELAAGIEDSKRRPFVWRQPILRTASNAKQV